MLPDILSLGGFLCICFFILFLFFKLINYMSTRSIRYYQRCIEIEQKCILFERDYLACFSEKAVAEYPQLSMHLAQPSKLLSFTGNFFADIDVRVSSDKKSSDILIREVISAPKEIQRLFFRQSEIGELLFRAKHPIRGTLFNLKKIVFVKILDLLIWICRRSRKKEERPFKQRIQSKLISESPLYAS
ncbi:MAG: hypothetical protein HFE43_07955 [Oscillospiraceae bacterium]|jgi:hypothetical protein|nr:hypothetical protein [Oscillospiraceae bacterium]